MINIGYRKGDADEVVVPLLHTITCAQTRYGKSTLQMHMMESLPDDYRVLCLDVKEPRDYEGAGKEIPIYIENRTDPLMLKQLLEQESHLWLRKEFPELIDLCREGDTYERVYERVCARMEEKVHPVVRDRLKVLRLLLKRLTRNMRKVKLSDELKLGAKVNVMNLSKVPNEVKQLAVYSCVKEILKNHQKTVILIDELPDYCPERYRTPSKSKIIEAIRKGGAREVWLWLSGQTITGVDKQVLKQAMIWILGHQREINEAKRTLDQIPFKTGLSIKDIMTLPVGFFIVCTDEGADMTYAKPIWLDEQTAKKVARGELSVRDVIKMRKGEDKLVWRKKYEQLKRDLEKRVEETRRKAFKEAMAKVEEIKKQWNVEELQKTIMQLKDEKANLEKQLEDVAEAFGEVKEKADAFEQLQRALAPFLPKQVVRPPGFEPGPPSEVVVDIEQPALTVNVLRKRLTLSQNDIQGRIAIVYAEGLLPDKSFSTSQLNRILESKFGTKEFPGNLPPACNKFVAWGFFEKVRAGKRWDYRVKMKPDEAKEKGLLKTIEKY